ncbi:MAG: MMPL family transporter [Alphaproteobacteria bacterium]
MGLRSTRLVAAILVTLVIGLAWAATFAAVAIGHLNLVSVTFAVRFIGVGVDFGIQFCLRYAERVAKGEGVGQALPNAAIGVGGALTLAAAGFFSLVPTAYIGLSALGIIAGVSMLIVWFANLTVLPALLAVMPLKNDPATRMRLGNGGEPTLGFVLRHPCTIVVAAVTLGLGAAILVPRVHFDFDPLNLNDPTTESVQTFHDLLRWDPSAAYTIAVVRPTLKEADKLAERLEQLPEVADALTASNFMPAHQDEKLRLVDSMALFPGAGAAIAARTAGL